MSSQASERSPLDQARAETNQLIHKVRDDLERLRTAPLNELETRIDSLNNSFKSTQESIIANVESALGTSETHSRDLEQSLQAEKERLDALTSKLSTQKQQAETKHSQLTVELASQKVNHGLTKLGLDEAKSALDEASRRTTGLEKDLQAVKQQNVDLQAEVESAKRQPADLQARLRAVEQQVADLEADRKAAAQRASTAEDELKTLKSHFKQISDITALVFPSEGQLTVAQPAFSSAQAPTKQGSMDEGKDGPQMHADHAQTQGLESHASNPMGNKEPDLLHCQKILDEIIGECSQFNREFLGPVDAIDQYNFDHFDAKMGPMNLSTMKEKLARGAYNSGTSFRTDFYLMIGNCRLLNPPENRVCMAAEEMLEKFEQLWSAYRISGHISRDHINQDRESHSHKRKASTEGPVSAEGDRMAKKTCGDPPQNDEFVQPANPVTNEGLHPASSQSRQSFDHSQISSVVDGSVWQGHLTTGRALSVDTLTCDVVAKRVSVVKPGNTCTDWERLIPHDLYVKAHALIGTVEEELFALNFDLTGDVITLRLEPASETDTSAFGELSHYLVSRDRYASVSCPQHGEVRKIYLIPALSKTVYPDSIPSLDYNVLPPAQTKNVMLMVVIHHVYPGNREPVRQAWNNIIKAVHSPDMGDLAIMRDHLIHHPLPIYSPRIAAVFGAERYIDQMLGKLTTSPKAADAKLAGSSRNFLRLSYLEEYQQYSSGIDGVKLPNSVFILGVVLGSTDRSKELLWDIQTADRLDELLVVDIQNADRPLWAIFERRNPRRPRGLNIVLLRSKFPRSWLEWEDTIVNGLHHTQLKKKMKNTGLRIERS